MVNTWENKLRCKQSVENKSLIKIKDYGMFTHVNKKYYAI